MDDAVMSADRLRERADHCLNLADTVTDEKAADQLRRMASEYLELAERMSAVTTDMQPAHDDA